FQCTCPLNTDTNQVKRQFVCDEKYVIERQWVGGVCRNEKKDNIDCEMRSCGQTVTLNDKYSTTYEGVSMIYFCVDTVTNAGITAIRTCSSSGLWSDEIQMCYGCVDGWTYFDHSCYAQTTTNTSWYDAMAICEAYNAHLVVIDTPGEFDFVVGMVKDVGETSWSGGTLIDGYTWTWGNSVEVYLQNRWCPLEPIPQTGNCLEITDCGYNDLGCSEMRTAMCEYDLVTVDKVGSWSGWSSCSEPCGNCGTRQRSRSCLSNSCSQPLLNVEVCPSTECEYVLGTEQYACRYQDSCSVGWIFVEPCTKYKMCILEKYCCQGDGPLCQ
ncbi:hypothetical protein ScPMuIL_013387, partial [Solemya velum]